MEVYLNRIDGWDDAIISMFLSKRTLTRELEMEIRDEIALCTNHIPACGTVGSFTCMTDKVQDWLTKLFKWAPRHITMAKLIDLSFSVYGLHRGAQD